MNSETSPEIDVLALQGAAEDLSDMWFVQALVALLETLGQAHGVRASLSGLLGGVADQHKGVSYFLTRLNASRKASVFAALAAEAYLNRLLYSRLGRADAEAIVGLRPVVDRFTIGTRLALGATLFPRDDVLYRDLKELFKLRNKLVHAEPREAADDEVFGRRAFEMCNPRTACAHVVTSAEAARRILPEIVPAVSTDAMDAWLGLLRALMPKIEAASDDPPPTIEEVRAEIGAAVAAHPRYFLHADADKPT